VTDTIERTAPIEFEAFADARLETTAALLETETVVAEVFAKLAVEPAGLDVGTADLLVRLAKSADCGMRGVEIGEQCLMTATRVSRLVDRAEEAGYVQRTPDPHDRRAQHVVLTDAGRDAARRYAPLLDRVIDELVFDTLDERERATLVRLLGRVQERARAMLARDGMEDRP
jgi:DNA-binding MarR family transcriptional regulator